MSKVDIEGQEVKPGDYVVSVDETWLDVSSNEHSVDGMVIDPRTEGGIRGHWEPDQGLREPYENFIHVSTPDGFYYGLENGRVRKV